MLAPCCVVRAQRERSFISLNKVRRAATRTVWATAQQGFTDLMIHSAPKHRTGPTPALWNETLGHGGHDY
eukprot:6039342-Prymnesium_polylepis.1